VFGGVLGLVAQPPEQDGEDWRLSFQPGDTLSFFPPWEKGGYDT
jgi:hypothetical protein